LINGAINNTPTNDTPSNANTDVTEQVRQRMLDDPLIKGLLPDLQQFANCTDDDTDMLDSKT
jgi:hypothetical protein